jgi:cyclopropane fatty-acyl-phospholipid synthase-like methyltransferase
MPEGRARPSVGEIFDRSHVAHAQSRTLRHVYEIAYGDEYLADAHSNGFITRSALERLVSELDVGSDQVILDLGCGHGAPGLWVARQTGSDLIGIDLSHGGIELAHERASTLGLSGRARFEVADLAHTGLPDGCAHAAMSIDVLVFVPDKQAALRETARMLRPGSRFVFTTWEQSEQTERLRAEQLADYRPGLSAAGFRVLTYEEVPGSKDQHRALLEGIIDAEQELAAELGASGAQSWIMYARGALAEVPIRRYIFVVAERT